MSDRMETPLVSIVVPVYGTEAYLDQCVKSLQNQTYANLEIILVDDGSPDGSPAICDRLAREDMRIHVIHKENGGLSSSRETGIMHCSGKYVMVVDSDDWIDRHTVEQCVEKAEIDYAECVMYGYVREYPACKLDNPLFEKDFSWNMEESEEKVHRRLVGPTGMELQCPERLDNLVSVCMKLYRTEVARKGRIVSERIVGTSEDTIFNLYALENCRISYVNQCFYHYRKDNPGSITTRYKPDLPEKWDALYDIFREYLDSRGEERYEEPFLNRVACGMIGLGLNEMAGPASFAQKADRLRQVLGKPLYVQAFSRLNTSFCPVKWKVFFFLCKRKAGYLLALLLNVIQILRSRRIG